MAGFTIQSVNYNSIKITITKDPDYKYYHVFIRKSSDTTDTTFDNWYTITASTSTKTISGLKADTDYLINVGPSDQNGSQTSGAVTDWWGAQAFTTGISKWSWTTAESNALQNHGAVSTITASRWNKLVDKVSDFRVATGHGEWNENYGLTKKQVKMDSDKILTATRYNSLKNNLGSLYSTGIDDVVKKQEVKGYNHFIAFTDKLNEAIEEKTWNQFQKL